MRPPAQLPATADADGANEVPMAVLAASGAAGASSGGPADGGTKFSGDIEAGAIAATAGGDDDDDAISDFGDDNNDGGAAY